MKMRKAAVSVILAAMLFVSLVSVAQAESVSVEPKGRVLAVFMSAEEMGLIGQVLAACEISVDMVLRTEYRAEMLDDYSFLITTCLEPQADAKAKDMPALLLGERFAGNADVTIVSQKNVSAIVSGGELMGSSRFEESISFISKHTGRTYGEVMIKGAKYPFSVQSGKEVYAPYYRAQDLSIILLGSVIKDFLVVKTDGSMYVMIDDVYAFTDFYSLCSAADMLYESAIPFIVRIWPIYDNLDYPAFKRYAQVLRYLQAKNGTIVIGEPLVLEVAFEIEPLADKMQRFTDALDAEGVSYFEMTQHPYFLELNALASIHSEGKDFGKLPIDIMIEFTLSEEDEKTRESVDALNNMWLSVESYRRKFTNVSYQYREVAIDDQYDYFVEEEKLFAAEFAVGNEVLIIIVGISILILLALLLLGSRAYRKKFYWKE